MKGCYLLGISFGSILAIHIAQNVKSYMKSSSCTIVAIDSSPAILPGLGGLSLKELREMDPCMCDDVILKSFYQQVGIDACVMNLHSFFFNNYILFLQK